MKVQIQIRGRSYTVRSDQDEDLPAIARYVDGKMAEIAEKATSFDDFTVAMLAALNIASELERARREMDAELVAIDRELASATMVLESTLPATEDPPQDGEG